MAHRPSTTEGMAASSSTMLEITRRILGLMKSSVRKIAVPTPSGTASTKASTDVSRVP